MLKWGVPVPITNSMEILLIEDSVEDARLTLRALKKAGMTKVVEVIRNGADALDFLFCQGAYAQRCPQDRPTLILLDLKLPKVTGLNVLEKVKSDPRTASIPVVMLTSSQEPADVAESYRLGVNSYIVKPVDFDGFLAAMELLAKYWLQLNHPPELRG